MIQNRKVLRPNINHLEISGFRFYAGLIIGLFYSFSLYAFLYMGREVFRILSIQQNYDLWVLTDSEVNFYNLFFAFVSVIFGQSFCFTYWIYKPKKFFSRINFRRDTIVNDQRVLMWAFLSWFSKLAVVYGIMFGFSFRGGYYTFSLYPDYKYIFVLVIIVLFLQSWNTIRQTFKRTSLKWLIVSALIVSAISFGMSMINVVDYNKLNESILQKNIHHNYILELPESATYSRSERLSLVENIYVALPKGGDKSTGPVIVIHSEEVALADLYHKINQLRLNRDDVDRKFMTFQLFIQKGIDMGYVNKLKHELSKAGHSQIGYMVTPINPKFDQKYYVHFSFKMKLPGIDSKKYSIHDAYQYFSKYKNSIEIKQLETDDCLVNDTLVELEKLKKMLKTQMQRNSNYAIKFYVNDSVDFSSYFKVLVYSKEAVNELRDQYSLSMYSRKYDELFSEDEMDDVQKKYPYRIIELSNQQLEILNMHDKKISKQ